MAVHIQKNSTFFTHKTEQQKYFCASTSALPIKTLALFVRHHVARASASLLLSRVCVAGQNQSCLTCPSDVLLLCTPVPNHLISLLTCYTTCLHSCSSLANESPRTQLFLQQFVSLFHFPHISGLCFPPGEQVLFVWCFSRVEFSSVDECTSVSPLSEVSVNCVYNSDVHMKLHEASHGHH